MTLSFSPEVRGLRRLSLGRNQGVGRMGSFLEVLGGNPAFMFVSFYLVQPLKAACIPGLQGHWWLVKCLSQGIILPPLTALPPSSIF